MHFVHQIRIAVGSDADASQSSRSLCSLPSVARIDFEDGEAAVCSRNSAPPSPQFEYKPGGDLGSPAGSWVHLHPKDYRIITNLLLLDRCPTYIKKSALCITLVDPQNTIAALSRG